MLTTFDWMVVKFAEVLQSPQRIRGFVDLRMIPSGKIFICIPIKPWVMQMHAKLMSLTLALAIYAKLRK